MISGHQYLKLGTSNKRREKRVDHKRLRELYQQKWREIRDFCKVSAKEIKNWQFNRIKELVDVYRERLINIVVDQSGIGSAVINELRDKGIMVTGQDFHPTKRNALLMNLKKILEQKTLVIPFNQDDANTQQFVTRLSLELVKFKEVTSDKTGVRLTTPKYVSTGSHDDTVMALAMACIGASFEQDTNLDCIASA